MSQDKLNTDSREVGDVLFDIAHEAHTLGRIYSQMGEPETPAEVCEQLKKMILQKTKPPT